MSASQHMRRLGQPIAYFPNLAKLLGGVNASIFFSQLFYWLPKSNHPDGIYKTAAVIEAETGLTVQEQRTARKKLVDLGVLVETNRRIEHRLYFRLDLARFDELSLQHSGSAESTFAAVTSNIPEMQNQHSGSAESTFDEMQNQHSYKEQENTRRLQQEITAGEFSAQAREHAPDTCEEKSKNAKKSEQHFDGMKALLALGVDAQVAADWLVVRKGRRAKLTQTALDGLCREAKKAGISAAEAVRICVERSWQSFNASWDWRAQAGKPKSRHDVPKEFSGGTTDEQLMRQDWYAMGEAQ